jgi:hypothetical protein
LKKYNATMGFVRLSKLIVELRRKYVRSRFRSQI